MLSFPNKQLVLWGLSGPTPAAFLGAQRYVDYNLPLRDWLQMASREIPLLPVHLVATSMISFCGVF